MSFVPGWNAQLEGLIMFIVFEGIEGSGKTTQAARLVTYLREKGTEVLALREPGGTAIGEQIRGILLDPKNAEISKETEILLFTAARAQLFTQVTLPALVTGKWVVMDRWAWSTMTYQGHSTLIKDMTNMACRSRWPDVTFLLDLPAEEGIRRVHGRAKIFEDQPDRIEQKELSFHSGVRQNYLMLANVYKNIVILDATLPPEDIFGAILAEVLRRRNNDHI